MASKFIPVPDPFEERPEFIGPRAKPCRLEDHRWSLGIEDGKPTLNCLDPCSEERKDGMDTERHGPMCDVVYEFTDFMWMEGEVTVRPEIKVEHTPSTPAGPAETDAWLVLHPVPDASPREEGC